MTDYAEPLLKIKAAIKELETALPNKEWGAVESLAEQIRNASTDLGHLASVRMYVPA